MWPTSGTMSPNSSMISWSLILTWLKIFDSHPSSSWHAHEWVLVLYALTKTKADQVLVLGTCPLEARVLPLPWPWPRHLPRPVIEVWNWSIVRRAMNFNYLLLYGELRFTKKVGIRLTSLTMPKIEKWSGGHPRCTSLHVSIIDEPAGATGT